MSSSSNAAARPYYPLARTGRSSRTLRPNRAALAAAATATAHLAAGSAASTPMIMKPSSAAIPTHPAVPARPTDRYRIPRAATASRAAIATSTTPGTILATTGTGQVHARPVTSATAQHAPTTGGRQQPAGGTASRVRAGELRRDQARVAELGHGGPSRRLGGQAQAQVPPVRVLQAAGQLLHHRSGQLTGQRVEIAGDQAGSTHRASARPFRLPISIGSNATLTLPSRQYALYSNLYM